MICDKCKRTIEKEEERALRGQTLCEDCYMDALSTVKACDPWAVHCAKSFQKEEVDETANTENQKRILHILKETGGLKLSDLSEQTEINESDLEREIATLRHMEKVRAELRQGEKIICLY